MYYSISSKKDTSVESLDISHGEASHPSMLTITLELDTAKVFTIIDDRCIQPVKKKCFVF